MSAAFWEQVTQLKTTECWPWNGQHDESGRPIFKSEKAYRVSYQLRNGDLISGNHVHHKCENCACVNPKHLIQLTPEEHVAAHEAIRLNDEETLRQIYSRQWQTNWIDYREERRRRKEEVEHERIRLKIQAAMAEINEQARLKTLEKEAKARAKAEAKAKSYARWTKRLDVMVLAFRIMLFGVLPLGGIIAYGVQYYHQYGVLTWHDTNQPFAPSPTPTPVMVGEVKPPRATLVAKPKSRYSLAELKQYRKEWYKDHNWYAVLGADKMIAEMEAELKSKK
jgi:hypothetical protein